jgi:hypothetical protein
LEAVIFDEATDLALEIAGQILVFQQDAAFLGLVPALDFALSLWGERRTADMLHFLPFQR